MHRSNAFLILANEALAKADTAEKRQLTYDAIAVVGESIMAAIAGDPNEIHDAAFALAERITQIAKEGAEALRGADAAQAKFRDLLEGNH